MEVEIPPPFSVFLGTSMRATFHIKFSDRDYHADSYLQIANMGKMGIMGCLVGDLRSLSALVSACSIEIALLCSPGSISLPNSGGHKCTRGALYYYLHYSKP